VNTCRTVLEVDGEAWNGWATALIESGFTYGEATLILARCDFIGWKDVNASQAATYRDAGFSPLEIAAWCPFAFKAPEAVAWAKAGWHPRQIQALRRTLRMPPEALWWPRLVQRLVTWRDIGIPPGWVVRYAAAGLTPVEAEAVVQRRHVGEDPSETLDVLTALRQPGPR
jgi:hypothetical protein